MMNAEKLSFLRGGNFNMMNFISPETKKVVNIYAIYLLVEALYCASASFVYHFFWVEKSLSFMVLSNAG